MRLENEGWSLKDIKSDNSDQTLESGFLILKTQLSPLQQRLSLKYRETGNTPACALQALAF